MKRLIIIFLFLSCAYRPTDNTVSYIPDITINDPIYYRWFRDSTLNDFIRPVNWGEIIPGEVVIHTDLNYYETEFPDTFWGVYYSYVFPSETLFCIECNCQNISTQAEYDMKWYFDSLEIEFN